MSDSALRGRLVNHDGELIAEGLCELDERAGLATLEPERQAPTMIRGRGELLLELDNGRSLAVSDPPMVVRIAPPGSTQANERRNLFRLRLVKSAQDAEAAGAEEGPPALRFGGETPAAR